MIERQRNPERQRGKLESMSIKELVKLDRTICKIIGNRIKIEAAIKEYVDDRSRTLSCH